MAVQKSVNRARKLKFRLWDIDSECYDNSPVISSGGNVYESAYDDSPTNAYVIEQCTGLKDINDKEIYEGDIVECRDIIKSSLYKKGPIVWVDDSASYAVEDSSTGEEEILHFVTSFSLLEVVSNIHEIEQPWKGKTCEKQ